MLKTLLGIRLRSAFGTFMGKKDGKRPSVGKIILITVLYVYLVGVFAMMAFGLAFSLAPFLLSEGLDWLYFGIFMLISFAVVFLLSIFETKSELFECKDNPILLPLPIRPMDIVLSRIFTVLIYNYVETAIFFFPALIVYALMGGSILGILGGFLVFLLLPLLATSLASAFGYMLAWITARLKKKSFVTVVLSVGFFLLYFWGYTALLDGSDMFIENIESVASVMAEELSFLYYIGGAAIFAPVPLVLFLLVSLGLSALAFYLISRSYFRIVSTVAHTVYAKSRVQKNEKSSVLFSLVRKELSRFVCSATYMVNCAFGIVMEVAVAVLAVVNRDSLIALAEELSLPFSFFTPVFLIVLIALSATTYISAPSISLEGKSIWIPRSLPLRARDVLLSKALLHILVCLPFNLISSVLMAIASEANFLEGILFILLPNVATAAFAFLGVILNAAFPKTEYENEAQPIKQSLTAFLSSLLPMLFTMGLAVGVFFLSLFGLMMLAYLLLTLVFLALAAIFAVLMLTVSVKQFDRLA